MMFILSRLSIVLFSCRGGTALPSYRVATHDRPNLMRAYPPTSFLRRFAPSNGSRRIIRLANPSSTRRMAIISEIRPDSEEVSPEKSEVCVQILCLHGKGGGGMKFINHSLMPLRSLLDKRLANPSDGGEVEFNISVHWECLTAPYELNPDDDSEGYSWWTMPSGVRSYNAQEVRRMNQILFLV